MSDKLSQWNTPDTGENDCGGGAILFFTAYTVWLYVCLAVWDNPLFALMSTGTWAMAPIAYCVCAVDTRKDEKIARNTMKMQCPARPQITIRPWIVQIKISGMKCAA